jgi:hypothetical protein
MARSFTPKAESLDRPLQKPAASRNEAEEHTMSKTILVTGASSGFAFLQALTGWTCRSQHHDDIRGRA